MSNTTSRDSQNTQDKTRALSPYSSRTRRRFDRVVVQETSTRGRGVFATSNVKARYAIGRVFGDVYPQGYRSRYCVEFGDGALEPYEPYRFLNHSCDPNCEFVEWSIQIEGQIVQELWLHALRDVKPGEELTIDYAWDWQDAIPCLCSSPQCRGWICKEDELALCIENNRKER